MIEFEAAVTGMEALARMGGTRAQDALEQGLSRAMKYAANQAKMNAPVDSGRLRASITDRVQWDSSMDLVGLIGTNVFYAPMVEYGTGALGDPDVPHVASHWPPGPALARWAQRHGASSGYAVAAAIGKRGGLRPTHFLSGAIFNPFMQRIILSELQKSVENFLGRVA